MATDILTGLFRVRGLPVPETEYQFHPERKWRWDWCWPQAKVALERQGGLHVRGRHSRARGQQGDYEKLAAGQLLGWMVFHASPEQIASGEAVLWVEAALRLRGLVKGA